MTGWVVPGFVHVRQVRVDPVGRRMVARHHITRRLVSITYLSQEFLNAEFRNRFMVESARLAQVRDPRVARLREYVECDDCAAIVAAHVDGTPLRTLLVEEGALTAEAAVVVLKDALRGLAASHAVGVAHGDLKPEDVLLTRAGRVRLVDLGLSTGDGRRLLARSTPFYLAPEQWSGGPATAAADVYAATATFFECLVGAPPFHADWAAPLRALHERGVPPLDAVPGPVRQLVQHGLAKDPENRPNARRLLAHVEEAATHGLGPGWERRGRRELTRLLSGPSHPSNLSVAAGLSDPPDGMARRPVPLAAVLGGALVVAAGLASPQLPRVLLPTGPIGGSGSAEEEPPALGHPVPPNPGGTAGILPGPADPVPDPQPAVMAEPVGLAFAGGAQRETMHASAPASSSVPHEVASAPGSGPAVTAAIHPQLGAPASSSAPTTGSTTGSASAAEEPAAAQTMSAPPTHPEPRSGHEHSSPSEEGHEHGVVQQALSETGAPWAAAEPWDQESMGLEPSIPEWSTEHEEYCGWTPEDVDW